MEELRDAQFLFQYLTYLFFVGTDAPPPFLLHVIHVLQDRPGRTAEKAEYNDCYSRQIQSVNTRLFPTTAVALDVQSPFFSIWSCFLVSSALP